MSGNIKTVGQIIDMFEKCIKRLDGLVNKLGEQSDELDEVLEKATETLKGK